MSEIKPLARRKDIVIQEFGNETLIYDLTANKAFNLNETSSLIWQLSTGNNTISEIASELSYKFNSPISEEFVWLALEQFRKDKLVENENEIAGLLDGLSRREIIRRVGLASVVMLPIVSSLVAPTAVQAAASSCPNVACRCPNASAICPGSTVPGVFVNCNTSTGNNACDCNGPYGAPDSAGAGFKTGTCSF